MRVLVRRLESKKGTTTFVDRTIDATSLRIGRGTDQELQLSDMRVALAHAEIQAFQGGPYRIEAKTSNGVWVNGGPCPGSTLDFNDTVDCGHYRLTILKPDFGVDLAVLVEEQSEAQNRPQGSGNYRTELQQTRLSRRGLAWAGFMLVLVTMLLVPLTVRYGTSSASVPGTPPHKALAWPNDEVWNSGTLSSTHAYFETDCASCHVQPFTPVRNDACLACHDMIRHHVQDHELIAGADFSGADCTDCHREHNGAEGTLVRRPSLCTDCHASPQERFPGSKLESVRSFSHSHPAFSPLVTSYDPATNKLSAAPVAQARDALLREDTNLKFPHDLHLDRKGIDAPEGTRVLVCADCHVADRGEISFEPVTMERHCADCHRLDFDKDLPDRVVPHGKPADVAGVIRDQTAAKALTGKVKALGTLPPTPERRRPGAVRAPVTSKEALATWTEQEGEQRIREMFEGRLCSKCHTVTRTQDEHLPYAIAPVEIREHTMSGAWFNHKPHALTPCQDCHAAEASSDSSDVLLPDIGNCRSCHGDPDSHSQVRSTCIDCHEYHLADTPLWDEQASQRKREAAMVHKRVVTPRGTAP